MNKFSEYDRIFFRFFLIITNHHGTQSGPRQAISPPVYKTKFCPHTHIYKLEDIIQLNNFLYCFLFKDCKIYFLKQLLHTLCVPIVLFILFCLKTAGCFLSRVLCTSSHLWLRDPVHQWFLTFLSRDPKKVKFLLIPFLDHTFAIFFNFYNDDPFSITYKLFLLYYTGYG